MRSMIAVFLTTALFLSGLIPARSAAAQVTAVPAPEDADDLPLVPWVQEGEEFWQDRRPTFWLDDPKVEAAAEGWIAVTDKAIRLRIAVKDQVHVGSSGGSGMWKNDAIQFGIDALGDGTMGRPADQQVVGRGDADYCVSLTDDGPKAYSYTHSAATGQGPRELPLEITRVEPSRLTVYDISVPWSEFQLCAAPSPVMGISIMVNDSAPDRQQQRLYWGTGVAGVFKPGEFKRVRVGEPDHDYFGLCVMNNMLSEKSPAAEALIVAATREPIQVVANDREVAIDEDVLQPLANADYRRTLRLELKVAPDQVLSEPEGFQVEVRNADGEAVARGEETLYPDYRKDWWAFEPENDTGPSAIGLEQWVEAPAGRRGGVRIVKDGFQFEDGTPIKFWGVNIGSRTMFSGPREVLDDYAKFYRKYGVNCIRIHKHMENSRGLLSQNSVLEFDPEKLDRYDYWTAELKENGVYHGLSHVFRMGLKPGDRDRVLAFDEIMKPRLDSEGNPKKDRHGNIRRRGHTVGFKTFAKDVQQIHIDQTVKILNHKNPYTGLRYAEDPALAFVEMHNEDDIFFYTTFSVIQGAPTYKKLICEMFSDWLKEEYGSHEGLVEAWGEQAINAYQQFHDADEHLSKRNIYPMTHAWWLSPEGIRNQESRFGTGKRLLDTARFMYDVQVDFYTRYEQAIRDTGYEGPIVGSCWKSSSGVPHYYNLHTDYLVGHIDRHGYYGGGGRGGHSSFGADSFLMRPRATMTEAFNQVIDRPFALSEWIGVNPYPWAADGPPVMAAYGLGLQGWDASYHFASSQGAYTDDKGRRWNVMQPTQIGQYPTLARMVYREDVAQAPVISNRRVHIPSLREGKLGFVEKRTLGQTADFNAISGDVPNEAIAAGRIVVEFTEQYERTPEFDIDQYMTDGVVKSVTGQLEWHTSESMPGDPATRLWNDRQGLIVINTPGTAGLVGYAPQEPHQLGTVTMTPQNLFSVVIVSAASPDGSLARDGRLLVTAVARSENTGQEFQPARTLHVTEKGDAPVLMEPVRVKLRVDRPGNPTVHVLDHDGRRTGRTLPGRGGVVEIDTGRDKTLYYELVYEDSE